MKVKFGALMVDGRGSAGGTTFSKNKSGSYARNKVTPTNPRTASQQQQRQILASFSQTWRGALSQDERQSWIDGAVNFGLKNIFGDTYYLSGNALYNKMNSNLSKVGASGLIICPTPIGAQNVSLVKFNHAKVGDLEINLSAILDGDNLAMLRATPAFSSGKASANNLLRDLMIIDTTDGVDVSILADYSAKFGTPIAGQKITVSVQVVNKNTGEVGVPTYLTAIITP